MSGRMRRRWLTPAGAGVMLIAGLVAFPRAQPVFRGSEILITETGYENLSQFVPIEVKDIEALMKR